MTNENYLCVKQVRRIIHIQVCESQTRVPIRLRLDYFPTRFEVFWIINTSDLDKHFGIIFSILRTEFIKTRTY